MTSRAPTSIGLALALTALAASPAVAQVAVLRVDPAAEPLCAALESALTDADLVPDPGYLSEARNQRVDPNDEATLEMLVPLLGLKLAVVPQSADERAVQVDFRDGRNGASLGRAAIPLEGGLLGFVGRNVLRREVFMRLGRPPPGHAAPEPGEDIGEDPEDEAEVDEPPSDSTLEVHLSFGLGAGTRALEWPVDGELARVETGLFAAYELHARFALVLSESVALGPELAYQSSLAHEIRETHVAAPAITMGVRAHRFAALLALRARFGSEDRFHVAPALGYGARSLRPEVHHQLTPSYSLAGPIARLALGVRIGEQVGIELAPEAQWIQVGDELEEEGVGATAVSVGGEARLSLELSSTIALELGYREAHALLDAREGSATDVERFVTTRLRWTP